MIDWLFDLDIALLHLFNVDFASPELDRFWLTITHLERQMWFILLLFPLIVGYLLYIYRANAFKIFLALGATVALSDAIAYRGIKEWVDRPRPIQDSRVNKWVREVGDAHGPSFPSNHAANCFAGALILAFYFPRGRKYFYTFALLVALSRVALGVHYPSDVFGGAMLGIVVGFLIKSAVLNRYVWFRLHNPVSSSDEESQSWRVRRLKD